MYEDLNFFLNTPSRKRIKTDKIIKLVINCQKCIRWRNVVLSLFIFLVNHHRKYKTLRSTYTIIVVLTFIKNELIKKLIIKKIS